MSLSEMVLIFGGLQWIGQAPILPPHPTPWGWFSNPLSPTHAHRHSSPRLLGVLMGLLGIASGGPSGDKWQSPAEDTTDGTSLLG